MAFGIKKHQILNWKKEIDEGKIAFLTHYWLDDRFPNAKSVTKVGSNNLTELALWGKAYHLKKEWIHVRKDGYSHYDLIGEIQLKVLKNEGLFDHIDHFKLEKSDS